MCVFASNHARGDNTGDLLIEATTLEQSRHANSC